jgi:hypothetical protein
MGGEGGGTVGGLGAGVRMGLLSEAAGSVGLMVGSLVRMTKLDSSPGMARIAKGVLTLGRVRSSGLGWG